MRAQIKLVFGGSGWGQEVSLWLYSYNDEGELTKCIVEVLDNHRESWDEEPRLAMNLVFGTPVHSMAPYPDCDNTIEIDLRTQTIRHIPLGCQWRSIPIEYTYEEFIQQFSGGAE